MTEHELDVRPLRKPDKHPTIFAAYNDLGVGDSFVLVNNHDPKHLRDEFDTEHPGSYGWEYVQSGPEVWKIRISKLTTTALPRILVNTVDLVETEAAESDATGAVWKLQTRDRDLDSNIIALPPAGVIAAHTGPDLDVLIHVLAGSGRLTTEQGDLDLSAGALVLLPRRSHRQFTAGPNGLRYFTVHQRRQSLVLNAAPRRAG